LEWLDARRRHFRRSFAQQLGFAALGALASTGMLLVGGALVIRSELSLGQLVAAEVVMALTVGSLAKIGSLLPKVYDLTSALAKLSLLLDLQAAPATPAQTATPGGSR
ncbi:MAG: ABC transporter ATP-binding protein, partial [Deltaproteobacteria bacterium]|nr:ABC transporter ATP-binding protein [Deltaproteobacteria bacterium]